MNAQYSVSEIIEAVDCLDGIVSGEKKIDKNIFKTSNLNMQEEPKEISLKMTDEQEEKKEIPQETESIIKDAETTITEEEPKEKMESMNLEPIQIDEIKKIEDPGALNLEVEKVEEDILVLKDMVIEEKSLVEDNLSKLDSEELKRLKEQVSVLRQHNSMLEEDLNKISKKINVTEDDKELQIKLELIYKQQKTIIDYENQIKELKEQNEMLEQNIKLPFNQERYEEELKNKSKIILDQQSILKDYQNKINNYQDKTAKLENEKLLLKKDNDNINSKLIAEAHAQKENAIAEAHAQKEKAQVEIKKINDKIRYYQEDNLRLSNEVVTLTGKLENTKTQLKQFENNKSKLWAQLEGLSNIISENNIIGTSFSTSQTTKADKTEEKEIPKAEKVKVIETATSSDLTHMNDQTKEIFRKK